MIKYLKAVIVLTLMLSLLEQISLAKNYSPHSFDKRFQKKYGNRRILVRYNDDAPLVKVDQAHFSVGAYVIKTYNIPHNLDVVEVTKGISMDAALEYYKENKHIKYAEPDYEYKILMGHAPSEPPTFNPSEDPPFNPQNPIRLHYTEDPDFDKQWALHNTGQDDGLLDVDLNGPEMWEELPGDNSIVTVVIDTGINYKHPDLRKRVWVNKGEIPNNGIDDDNNGVIDDYHGFNAIAANGDPMDDNGHGTHCAGIIAAEGGNGIGTVGVNPLGTVMGCKFLSASGNGSTSGAIDCLHYVRDLKTRKENPVNIVATSNSWGGGPPSQALEEAIKEHLQLGILFIAAASNDGLNNDETESFPANYNLANIISVAATDRKDNLADFSNYGKRTVHVGAPGVEIYSTVLGNGYEKIDGTSMATPFVAGLANMIKASNPNLNYTQIKNLILAGGVPNPSLAGKTISGRRIRAIDRNGLGSLSCRDQVITGRLSPSRDRLLVAVGQNVLFSAININCSEPNGSLTVPVSPHGSLMLSDSGLGLDSALNDGVYSYEWTPAKAGSFKFNFPDNDIVTVNVYDPSSMKAYKTTAEENFNYRYFSGEALHLVDDSVKTISPPFPLKFGGEGSSFDELTIDSNGVMTVTGAQAIGFNNQELPFMKNMTLIAPFWDDLYPGVSNGDVYIATIGQAPKREFVVEWRDVRHYNSLLGATFQVVFFEDSSDILFNYLDVNVGNIGENNGASATVGIQTTKDRYYTYAYDQAKLQDNMGLRFKIIP